MSTPAPDLAIVFPGQGSQTVGMGRDLADRFEVARDTFREADEVLGRSLSELCWNGPEAELTRTENAQPALLVHSVAAWRLVEPLGLPIVAAAGHSLGEWSAHVAAGTIEFADALRTVALRGRLMGEAGKTRPGTMSALLGLDDAEVERVCREASTGGEVVVAANLNAPGQVVISGDPAAVARAADLAKSAGARRALPLNVSGAFHSPLVADAAQGLGHAVAELAMSEPRFPVVANASARPVRDAATARQLLVAQLTAPVRWAEGMRSMVTELGVRRVLELGPGGVLAGLAKRIDRELEARSVGTADAVDELRAVGSGSWS